MYYVSAIRGDYLGVTDTKDNVEEFYTIDELKTFNVEIIGFNEELPSGYEFETKCFNFELIKIDDTEGWRLEHNLGYLYFIISLAISGIQ